MEKVFAGNFRNNEDESVEINASFYQRNYIIIERRDATDNPSYAETRIDFIPLPLYY